MASFGRISIEVRKGSELVAMNPGKTANPFVRISAGKNSFDTEVVEKTVNPTFEKGKHVFPPCPLPTILTINVFNKLIYLEEDEPMGTATVTIFSAGPETTKTVFLTHGGNVKLAAKARGGCGTMELVYTVTPCDSLDDEPPAAAAANIGNSSSAPPVATTTTTAMSLSSSVPDFLRDGGGGAPAATKPATDDPFEDMFGEKKKPEEIPAPPVVSTPTQPEPAPQPVAAAPVATTPTADAPPVSQYTSPPAAPETPPTQTTTTTTTNVVPDSLTSTPAAGTPATPEPPGPLGQPVQTTTTTSAPTAAAVPPPATAQSASSSIIATPTSANGDTKQFTPPPPLPAEPAPVSAVNTTKQVTFDGKSLKNLAINKRRSPSAGATRTTTTTNTPAVTKSTAPVRSTSASRNARGPSTSTTSARKMTTTTTGGPSATSALHNSHTAASSGRVNPVSTGALVAASASAHNHNGGPITSAQQLQHTNPHVAFLYTGDNAKSLLAAAISGSQKEFAQVKEIDPLLMNGFLAVKDYSGRNALHLAAWHGNPAVIDQLINGRNPSGVAPRIDMAAMTTTSGNTLLHCAALGGDPRTVEWLLFQPSCQSLISMSNKRGLTPYQAALEAGNTDCAAAIQTVTSRGGGGMGPTM